MPALQPEPSANGTTPMQDAPRSSNPQAGFTATPELLVINGSPRGFASNSRVVLSWMFPGVRSPLASVARDRAGAGGRSDLRDLDLRTTLNDGKAVEALGSAKRILLVFPLYTDSVPGLVKCFIDEVGAAARAGRISLEGKELAFVVHSGFPESIQSEPCVAYMRRLCERWGCAFLGAAIKGGSEGIRLMPASSNKKLQALFARLGADFLAGRPFDPATVATLAQPRVNSPRTMFMMRIMEALNITNLYWVVMLRRHKAWAKRFDQPYADALREQWQ